MAAGADCFWSKPLQVTDQEIQAILTKNLELVQEANRDDETLMVSRHQQENQVINSQAIHTQYRQKTAQIIHDMGTPMQVLSTACETGDLTGTGFAMESLVQLRSMLMDQVTHHQPYIIDHHTRAVTLVSHAGQARVWRIVETTSWAL